jgi:hypothetical protein
MKAAKTSWRKIIVSSGCAAGGIALLIIAVAAFNGGAILPPSGGSRFGPPRAWTAASIDSPVSQVAIAVCMAFVGVGLLWLAYKIFRGWVKLG